MLIFTHRLVNSIVLLLVCFISGCAVQTVANPEKVLNNEEWAPALRNVINNGDWLVVRGIHATDNFVATVTTSPFSHAAIYDAERDEVIEAEGMGVHSTSFPVFLAKSQRVLIIRPMWANEENRIIAVAQARSWVGKKYDYTGLVGLNAKDRYYCTELVLAAYRPLMTEKPDNPLPPVLVPGQMHHWGRIVFDTGP